MVYVFKRNPNAAKMLESEAAERPSYDFTPNSRGKCSPFDDKRRTRKSLSSLCSIHYVDGWLFAGGVVVVVLCHLSFSVSSASATASSSVIVACLERIMSRTRAASAANSHLARILAPYL